MIDVFKKGQPIVLGIYQEDSGFFSSISAENFTLKLAYVIDPLNEWELNVSVIDDNPYWWCEPFYIFKAGDYILHWDNEKDDVNIKQRIRILDEYFNVDDSELLV